MEISAIMIVSNCLCIIAVISLIGMQYHVTAQSVVPQGYSQWHGYWYRHWYKPKTCPMDAKLSPRLNKVLDTLFPGLFVNLFELKGIVFENFFAILLSSVPKLVLSTTPPDNPTEPTTNNVCCQMITEVIKPLTVQQDGTEFRVVHLVNDDQLVTTTSCVNLLGPCQNGRCFNRRGYNWVLIYDLELNYYPPVRFIPLEINVGCECL